MEPPQQNTKAEVMRMSNIELLNILLAIAGLLVGVYTLGLKIDDKKIRLADSSCLAVF